MGPQIACVSISFGEYHVAAQVLSIKVGEDFHVVPMSISLGIMAPDGSMWMPISFFSIHEKVQDQIREAVVQKAKEENKWQTAPKNLSSEKSPIGPHMMAPGKLE